LLLLVVAVYFVSQTAGHLMKNNPCCCIKPYWTSLIWLHLTMHWIKGLYWTPNPNPSPFIR